jgi:hypothetical protein
MGIQGDMKLWLGISWYSMGIYCAWGYETNNVIGFVHKLVVALKIAPLQQQTINRLWDDNSNSI